MTPVPNDIMYKAGQVVADLCDDTRMLLSGEIEAMAMPIAGALLAERERCAKVCRDMAASYEASKEESVNWESRAGELRWVAGLIDGTMPSHPDVRSKP